MKLNKEKYYVWKVYNFNNEDEDKPISPGFINFRDDMGIEVTPSYYKGHTVNNDDIVDEDTVEDLELQIKQYAIKNKISIRRQILVKESGDTKVDWLYKAPEKE